MSGAQPEGEAPAPRISVIVPTYNRAGVLARLLQALERQTAPVDAFEVIVIDDGSTDATASVLAQDYRYRLRALTQTNAGPAAARNAGIARASGAIILFVDDDVIPRDDLVERHLALHATGYAAVIGRIAAPTGVRQPAWARWELDTLERQYDDMAAGRFQPCARQFFTANASVRRDALVRAGLFDAEFRRAEDVELAYRLEEQGMRFLFASDAVVLHDTPRSLAAWMSVAEQYGEYDVLMWRRGVRYMLEMTAEDLAYARKLPLRLLARILVGRRLPMGLLRRVGAIGISSADRLSRATEARAMCSVVFNLLYWDAFAHAVGGRTRFWELMASELRPPWPAAAVE